MSCNQNNDNTELLTRKLPKSNKCYSEQEYWEDRFAKENHYEWLVSYPQIKPDIIPFLKNKEDTKILIIGCGNSSFSFDLYDDGYKNITNIDYSKNVIENMEQKDKEKYGGTAAVSSKMTWKVMDMIHMEEFANESFDVVIDKAGIDAITTKEGDVWNPSPTVIEDVFQVCSHISRTLNQKNGCFLSISFVQPHFRKKYLLDVHERNNKDTNINGNISSMNAAGLEFCDQFHWTLKYGAIGDGNSGFPNYLYVMHKK